MSFLLARVKFRFALSLEVAAHPSVEVQFLQE